MFATIEFKYDRLSHLLFLCFSVGLTANTFCFKYHDINWNTGRVSTDANLIKVYNFSVCIFYHFKVPFPMLPIRYHFPFLVLPSKNHDCYNSVNRELYDYAMFQSRRVFVRLTVNIYFDLLFVCSIVVLYLLHLVIITVTVRI